MRCLQTKKTLMIAAFMLTCTVSCLSQCPTYTTKGNDFWVTFLYNQNISHPTTTDQRILIATGDQSCTIDFYDTTGNVSHVSLNASGGAGSCQYSASTNVMRIAQPFNGAYHVTSSEDIWLYARNLVNNTEDIASVIPTSGLASRYIIQDYPSTQKGGEVAFVATENGTVLTMTVPCNIRNTSITAGTTLNVSLNSGQTYLLMTEDVSATFSGMVVESNNKPFAVFQGAWNPAVPATGSGRDHVYEQAVPPEFWDTCFIVAGATPQTGNNKVRITSQENNCTVFVNGNIVTTLNATETYEYSLTPSQSVKISSSAPVSVIMYLGSFQNNGIGDPSSVTIPPVSKGICDNVFVKATSDELPGNSQHLVVVCHQDYDSGLRINGNTLPTSVYTIGNYKIHRLNTELQNINHLSNTQGPFVAYTYALGSWISYAYHLGMSLEPLEPPEYDTVEVFDTTCVGTAYSGYGFTLSATANSLTGTRTLVRDETAGATHTHYVLHLTVWPTYQVDVYDSLAYGDTLIWCGQTVTSDGNFQVTLTSQYSCDSTVTLHVTYTGFDTVFLFDTTCSGTPYNSNGFTFETTGTVGDTAISRYTMEGTVPTMYILHLTVLPVFATDTNVTIINGDTLIWNDTLITLAGDYLFLLTATNGCDSIVTLHVSYAAVELTCSADGVCPGEEVTITASGTHTFVWSSAPYDPDLDSQQGCNPVTVHPTVTTTYYLLAGDGNIISSVTVGTAEPPILCVETNHDFIDFDHPKVVFDDCSEGRHSSTWYFSDGVSVRAKHVVRTFDQPLPDSIVATLVSCNQYDCCSDTSFSLPCRIRSMWFPNVFTPDAESNNLFRPFTSRDITVFEIDIFDRWGLLVWSSTDLERGWDGRMGDGTRCTQGAYVYRYYWRDADGDAKSGVGTVTLIR